jgi:hypothetical protein
MMRRYHREELIRLSGVKLSVPPGQGLAIKTELGIPWNKMRHIRRFAIVNVQNSYFSDIRLVD